MGKFLAIFNVLRKGGVVADPKLWKDRTALTLALSGLFLALARAAAAMGHPIPLTEADAGALATAVAVVVGLLGNYATSDKVGVLPPAQPPAAPQVDAGGDDWTSEPHTPPRLPPVDSPDPAAKERMREAA